MTGKVNIQKHTIKEIMKTHEEEDGDAYKANIAVWFYENDEGKKYLAFELSPFYRPRARSSEKDMTADEFFDDIAEEQD
jgi:hypothetical protein